MQIHADVLRRPLVLLSHPECTVLGAAILGAVGSGNFPSIFDAVEAMVTVDRTIEPRDETASVYADLFEIFRMAYETNARSGMYDRIYDFQRRFF